MGLLKIVVSPVRVRVSPSLPTSPASSSPSATKPLQKRGSSPPPGTPSTAASKPSDTSRPALLHGVGVPKASRPLPARPFDLLLSRHDRLALQLTNHARVRVQRHRRRVPHLLRQLRDRQARTDLQR